MSVQTGKRKESKLIVEYEFFNFRQEFVHFLIYKFYQSDDKIARNILKKFHVKSVEELSEEDRKIFERSIDIQKTSNAILRIDYGRILNQICSDINMYIVMANAIYPNYLEEYVARKIYQDKAVAKAYALLSELNFCAYNLHASTKAVSHLCGLLNLEIKKMRAWREEDYRRFKSLKCYNEDFEKKTLEILKTCRSEYPSQIRYNPKGNQNLKFENIECMTDEDLAELRSAKYYPLNLRKRNPDKSTPKTVKKIMDEGNNAERCLASREFIKEETGIDIADNSSNEDSLSE